MSGIFGFFQENGSQAGSQINMKQMQLWNAAYGREDEEIFTGECFGLGCCYEKLSVETAKSNPIIRNNHKYAVIDALLYNRDELMERCKIKETLSDEELLLDYVDRFGMDALKDVNGDFCGAIYDDNDKTLTLFRDHLGVRPLFYFYDEKMVIFSSDIRGLTALLQVDVSVDETWVYKTIAAYPALGVENTEFEHIFCVKPAGYMKFSCNDNRLIKEQTEYWQLGSKKIRLSSEKAYQEKLRELITDSVKRRLDAVPGTVGAELSGGLDSGVIDILINRLGREGVYFSWSADPKELRMAERDERLVIQDICKQENITCNYGGIYLNLDAESNIAESMRKIGVEVNYDEQTVLRFVLPPYSNTLTICETAQCITKNGARVVFTGHGGDEGVSHRCNPYEMFHHHEYYRFFRHMWSTTHGQKNRIIKTLKKSYKILSETRKDLKKPFQMWYASSELLKEDFLEKFNEKEMPRLAFAYDPKDYIKGGGSRNRLDNMAMLGAYSGVRYIAPYLDYRVIDFAVSIPRYLYMKGRKNRYIFREAFKDIMPRSLYNLYIKEDNSRNNVEEDPNWFEEFAKLKRDAVSKLDREYWEKYLNFDVIDEWLKRGKPSEEERSREERILRCLFYCAMLGNVIERTRETDQNSH